MARKLVVSVTGNYTERLLALGSALHAGVIYKRPISIVWEQDRDCYADFAELFDSSSDAQVNPVNKFRCVNFETYHKDMSCRERVVSFRSGAVQASCLFWHEGDQLTGNIMVDFKSKLLDITPFLRFLQPRDQVIRVCQGVKLPPQFVGVRISTQDGPNCISRLVKNLNRSFAPFYLSTPSEELAAEMSHMFTERCFSREGVYHSTGADIAFNCQLDVHILSMASQIIASHHDSMGLISNLLGDAPMFYPDGPRPSDCHH
jgi:hypothetical protein